MSDPTRQSGEESKIDLGTGIHWPAVCGVAIVVIAVVAGLAALCAVCARVPADKSDAAVAKAPEATPNLSPPATGASTPAKPGRTAPHQSLVGQLGFARAVVAEPEKREYLPLPAQATAASANSAARLVGQQTLQAQQVSAQTGLEVADNVCWVQDSIRFRRLDYSCELDLRVRLHEESHEVDIEAAKGAEITKKLAGHGSRSRERSASPVTTDDGIVARAKTKIPPVFNIIAERDDLRGLPMRNLPDCQASEKDAQAMTEISRTVRTDRKLSRALAAFNERSHTLSPEYGAEVEIIKHLQDMKFDGEAGSRLLAQMFLMDSRGIRHYVVGVLGKKDDKAAGEALARMAAFDLDQEVREAAIVQLGKRPPSQWRSILLSALRYPWVPVAQHAAEALVALKDTAAAPALAELLDERNPNAPTQTGDGRWQVAELVRLNHLANCVLCHPASNSSEDPVRGVVPERGQPLPEIYYGEDRGLVVRADITYMRQDFSLMQEAGSSPLADSFEEPDKNKKTDSLSDSRSKSRGGWPVVQRFDYLVRMKDISAEQVDQFYSNVNNLGDYPQRRAVLWALRELTSQDLGERAQNWRRYLEQTYASPDP
jgi:hypothetical protein